MKVVEIRGRGCEEVSSNSQKPAELTFFKPTLTPHASLPPSGSPAHNILGEACPSNHLLHVRLAMTFIWAPWSWFGNSFS